MRPLSSDKRLKQPLTKRLSRLEIGLALELAKNEYSVFIKKLKVYKEKKATVVPVLARKMTITTQLSIDVAEPTLT